MSTGLIPLLELEAPLIDPEDFHKWILYEDDDALIINKPGWVVCHPSKHGPYSSLVGASKAHTGLETLHLISRLDRETSGLVIIGKQKRFARAYQMALQNRIVRKTYVALQRGSLPMGELLEVNQHLAKDLESPVYVKQTVRKSNSSRRAVSRFFPLVAKDNVVLSLVFPETGRKHQIRAHAEWLGAPIIGDKIYGGNPQHYLDFIQSGWSGQMAADLLHPRQALHCLEMEFKFPDGPITWKAPPTEDFLGLCSDLLEYSPAEIMDRIDTVRPA